MTVSAGATDRTNLNAENGNLIAALVANPDLLKTVLNEIYDYLDANWNDYSTHKTSAVLGHPDGSVTTSKLADKGVTNAKLGDLSVTSAKLANLAVTSGKINDLAVLTGKLADLAVTTAKIADLAISTGKLADLSVTTGKIADQAVTASKIDPAILNNNVDLGVHRTNVVLDHPDGSVTGAKLSQSAVADSLGYTPVNKSGDTMTGKLIISNEAVYPHITVTKQSSDGIGTYPVGISTFYIDATANGFPATYSTIITVKENDNRAFQYCVDKGSGAFFVRSSIDSTTWNNWNTIWHSGNDGTGSNLSADNTDGIHFRVNAGILQYSSDGTNWSDIGMQTAIKSIQKGTTQFAINDSSPKSITISAVNTSKTIINIPYFSNLTDSSYGNVSGYATLTNSTTLALTIDHSGSSGSITVAWEVIEYV